MVEERKTGYLLVREPERSTPGLRRFYRVDAVSRPLEPHEDPHFVANNSASSVLNGASDRNIGYVSVFPVPHDKAILSMQYYPYDKLEGPQKKAVRRNGLAMRLLLRVYERLSEEGHGSILVSHFPQSFAMRRAAGKAGLGFFTRWKATLRGEAKSGKFTVDQEIGILKKYLEKREERKGKKEK